MLFVTAYPTHHGNTPVVKVFSFNTNDLAGTNADTLPTRRLYSETASAGVPYLGPEIALPPGGLAGAAVHRGPGAP